ncbi:hypothetical protein NKDENANG_03991 [Candidatus Entotheonellaceae bacterium PAL068K]
MQEGAVTRVIVLAAIEIIDVTVFEQCHGPFANLVRRAVIQTELPAASTNIDPTMPQDNGVLIEALMGISDDE